MPNEALVSCIEIMNTQTLKWEWIGRGQRLKRRISYLYGIQIIELENIRLVFLKKFAHLSIKNLGRVLWVEIEERLEEHSLQISDPVWKPN